MNLFSKKDKALPQSLWLSAIPVEVGKQYAFTTVKGTVEEITSDLEGMSKGKTIHVVTFSCPSCGKTSHFHAATDHPTKDHPVKCLCDITKVFLVKWG